jgi:HEAT repeat protein
LLRDSESISTRIAALRGLGELGDPRAGDAIVRLLTDPENAVRLQAVRNLSRLQGATVYAENLRRLLDPQIERDASVRDQTWVVLQSMLPNLPKEQLQQWSDRFRQDPDRRLLVLKALSEKLVAARLEDELAGTNQNIGETLMRLNRPEEASTYFDIALAARKQQRTVPGAVIDMLTAQLLQSYLQARRFDAAVTFASASIRENEQKQFIMGLEIRKEIDRLRAAKEFEPALALVDASRRMQPPLAQQYQDQITELEADIRRQLSPSRSTTTAPQSSTRPIIPTTRPTATAGVQ